MRPNLHHILWASLLLVGTHAAALLAAESKWVGTGVTGRLIYTPDAQGDRIMDFSDVGYLGRGSELIPDYVPNVVTVLPITGDDTANIQAAIDYASGLPLQSDGFRGAVLLSSGEYDIASQLNITASGVVLRGVGRDAGQTVLHARGTAQRSLVNVVGAGSQSLFGSKRNMIDKVVPVGATSFRVDSTAGLAVGGTVRVERPSTANWIHDLGMDNPPDNSPAWVAGTMNIRYDRMITRIEGNRIFLDAPLANAFELQYGGGTIQSYSWTDRIQKIGVENMRAESDFAFATDENHAWEFVSIENAQNVWVRHTTSQFFANSAVVNNPTGKWVTVEDAINLDPKSTVTGERRYTFNLSGQLDFVTNSQANSGRHDFVNNSTRPPGPHVFHNSVANNALNDSGPHQRWATGSLFDNITVQGNNIDARNRGSLGTTHGWSGANMVIWNSTAAGFIVQNPPTAQNWLIGSTGAVINDTEFGPQPAGYVDSHGSPVTVGGTNSLYDAQMNDSADIREFHWGSGNGNWSDALGWQEGVKPGVYRVSSRDYLVGDIDSFTNDGVGSVDAAYIDPAWVSTIQSTSALPITGFDDLGGNKNVAFTVQHQLDAGERVVHGYLALGLKQSGGDTSTDSVRLFDTAANHKLNFADMGWTSQISASGTFVGVIDMGAYRDKLQSGSVNVQINDDTGADWAMYVATVATPIADANGPSVFIDGAGVATVDSVIGRIRDLQIGGANSGTLLLQSPASINITNDFDQLANGNLTIVMSATTPAAALLNATGSADLAGTLAVQLAAGFTPAVNTTYQILSAAAGVHNDFDALLLPELQYGTAWQLSYNATSVDLKMIASFIVGDYDHNGKVDAADYVIYRQSLGQMGTGLPADGNGNQQIDTGDYDVWRSHFGDVARNAPEIVYTTLVPEPSLILLIASAVITSAGASVLRSRRPEFRRR